MFINILLFVLMFSITFLPEILITTYLIRLKGKDKLLKVILSYYVVMMLRSGVTNSFGMLMSYFRKWTTLDMKSLINLYATVTEITLWIGLIPLVVIVLILWNMHKKERLAYDIQD